MIAGEDKVTAWRGGKPTKIDALEFPYHLPPDASSPLVLLLSHWAFSSCLRGPQPGSVSGFWTWCILPPRHQCGQAFRFSGLFWEPPIPVPAPGSLPYSGLASWSQLGGGLLLYHWLKKPGANTRFSKQRIPESKRLQRVSPSVLPPSIRSPSTKSPDVSSSHGFHVQRPQRGKSQRMQ